MCGVSYIKHIINKNNPQTPGREAGAILSGTSPKTVSPPLPTPTPSRVDGAYPAFTVTLVVMNSAIPGFFITGSGTGPTGVGCIAGAVTLNSAGNGVPLMRIALPFFVNIVLFKGSSVTETVPIPGVTKGGEV